MKTAFFDTNLFVYADDRSDPNKQACAIDLISLHAASNSALISLQVMQEYFSAATRKLGLDPEAAQKKVEVMARMRVVLFSEEDVVRAIEIHRLRRVSFWDGLIIHAAQTGAADVLYSEDLQHGARYGRVQVANPFS